ncbi:unnamed protein product [Vitrella brassicaformis CCMP3155]|uniref:Uncharacterized protein n=1 Tax=Vitrella brassicaformis (strain CCMP3155) TaxID=1169540 RepID=A0A0G4GPG4_VITBC|nr:unnamed protein product [Vitrella brassicaformis CCMP3155]|eukprot:CEM32243.1 unnamed protein product [Vitrella brassicaformis CCMP3155]
MPSCEESSANDVGCDDCTSIVPATSAKRSLSDGGQDRRQIEKAYEVLGLQPGRSREVVERRFKALTKGSQSVLASFLQGLFFGVCQDRYVEITTSVGVLRSLFASVYSIGNSYRNWDKIPPGWYETACQEIYYHEGGPLPSPPIRPCVSISDDDIAPETHPLYDCMATSPFIVRWWFLGGGARLMRCCLGPQE